MVLEFVKYKNMAFAFSNEHYLASYQNQMIARHMQNREKTKATFIFFLKSGTHSGITALILL